MSSIREINSLGRKNVSTIIQSLGFKNINQAIESFGEVPKARKYNDTIKKRVLELMREEYNVIAQQINNEAKIQKKIVQKKKIEFLNNFSVYKPPPTMRNRDKVKTFTIDYHMKTTYKKSGQIKYHHTTAGPYTIAVSNINKFIKTTNHENSETIDEVIQVWVNFLNIEQLIKDRIPKANQMMKRSYVLNNKWLRYSKSIAPYAFDDANDECVYHQLSKYLLDPPSGRATKFINGQKTSGAAIFKYFQSIQDGDKNDFKKNSGVSTSMVADLCKTIHRSVYAYDEDSKCFFSLVETNENRNYCPVIFYKLNGHMYLLNTSEAIKSVAESNKKTARKMITSSIDEGQQKENNLEVFNLEWFDVETAMKLKEGIYLVQKSNLSMEIIEFIRFYKDIPKVRNIRNSIVEIQFFNEDDKVVVICCDINFAKNIDYLQMKRVAEQNKITYINNGVGFVIGKIIENSKICVRKTFTEQEKKDLIIQYKNCCAICKSKTSEFEIDHIMPLACGGSNEIENIQPLCIDCHKTKTSEEQERGYCVIDETASYFNKKVCDEIADSIAFKSHQFVERVDSENYPESFKIDMQKCRRNLTYQCEYEFPVYGVMDIPVPFSGEIKCGLYYVITDNTFPFRGSGWYHEALIQYGIDNELISLNDIRLEFLPSKKLPNNYFQTNIDLLLNAFEIEPSLQKLAINAYIGLMGRTKRSSCKSKFSLCPYEASTWYSSVENANVFIRNHTSAKCETIYEGIETQSVLEESTTYPIYSMILQLEAIELHRLETLVLRNGGRILDRNTDAIRYFADKEINIDKYFWDKDKTIQKYQVENSNPLKIESLAHFNRNHILDLSTFELNWEISHDYLGTVEKKAKELVDGKKSFHIDGLAGTGKSYLTNKIIDILKENDKKYMAFSPTNKGARIIDGKTIHSMYYKYKRNKYKLIEMLTEIEYILIDEVSMMTEMFYKLFIMIKKIFPTMRFIISGDFGQLPPVNDTWSGDYKNSASLFELCDGNRVQLTQCRRSDDVLFNLCKNVESIDIRKFKPTEMTYLNIAYLHKTRIQVNNKCMESFVKDKPFVELKQDKHNPKTQDLKLCVGMPVIAHKTNKKLNVLNSERFVIKSVTDEIIEIKEDNRLIEIKTQDFHKFFYLGFCITVHASQGDTFKVKYTIYDWKNYIFSKKAKYVAMSRGTSIQNIQIANNI